VIDDELQVATIADQLKNGSAVSVRLHGRSMLPIVFPGTLVSIEPVTASECREGDVVVVQRGGTLSAHRWLGGARDARILQGDAFDLPDRPVVDEQVLGRAAALLVGRWTIPVPSSFRPWLSRSIARAVPALRRSSREVQRVARATARGAQRSGAVNALRRRLLTVTIERLQLAHLEEIPSMLLTHGRRPTRAALATWERLASSKREAAFVARARGRIVGYSSVRDERANPTLGRCGYLWVDRWYRGLGIAGALKAAVVRHAREVGYRELGTRARWGSDSMRASLRLGFLPSQDPRDPSWALLRLTLTE